jgi:tRNA U34 5-carboxymethylaminomethyl modifying GTPase MnmE/TrmE
VIFINKISMKDIILTEKQLETLVTKMKTIKEDHKEGSYMAKQQLFTIVKMAEKMWEKMEENESETLDDWMESKIAQAEQSISSVVKAYMYDELTDENEIGGMNKLGYDDLIIGK